MSVAVCMAFSMLCTGCSYVFVVPPGEAGSCADSEYAPWLDIIGATATASTGLFVTGMSALGDNGSSEEPSPFQMALASTVVLTAAQVSSAVYGFSASGRCAAMRGFKALQMSARKKHSRDPGIVSPVEDLRPQCSRGDQRACARLGMQVFLHSDVPQDVRLSNSLFATACEAGVASACYNLAISYE
jgi:hypothetical protein